MKKILAVVAAVVALSGCVTSGRGDGPGTDTGLTEAVWIRNAEPLVFENEDWFPTDEVENLLDSEVFQIGVARDVPFFIERTDIRPYDRLYTRFAKNRYRAFEQ
jgi:hypothetical protein